MIKLFRLTSCILLGLSFQSCDEQTKEDLEGLKVERCEDENDESTCYEFRVTESSDETTYALGDFSTIRTDNGTFTSSATVDMNFLGTSSVETCGGTLVSKAVTIRATKSNEELYDRDDISNKPMYVRLDTNEIVADRDNVLFAVVMRSPPSSDVFYVDSNTYQPSGDNAIDELDVNFYSDDPNAAFYLVTSDSGLETPCAPYILSRDEEE